ncbi:MAG: polysaccharide deacetylase family protein [Prochlorococcaceae cyanobacterium]
MDGLARGVILSYHRITVPGPDPWGMRVTPARFAAQMGVVANCAEPVSLRELASESSGTPQHPVVAVTFDDGYLDNVIEGFPILDMHKVPATIFVASGYTGQQHFWWDILEHVFLTPGTLPDHLTLSRHDRSLNLELGEAHHYSQAQYQQDCIHFQWKGKPGTRMRAYFQVHEYLSQFHVEARIELSHEILAWAGGARHAEEQIRITRPMSSQELIDISANPLVSIGGHTVNHPILATLDPAHQTAEILGNKTYLESLLGIPVDTFAYPHGSVTDQALAALKNGGFVAACTTRERAVTVGCSHLKLPRLTVKDWEADEFQQRIEEVLFRR